MFGYQVTAFGGVDVMNWVELPDPAPGPGQLRVAVRASGINFAETRMRAGTYGSCEVCDAKIPMARLTALPYATYCIDCQRASEEGGPEWRQAIEAAMPNLDVSYSDLETS